MTAIFVYGLLKPGLSLHHIVEPFIVRSTPGTTTGRLYDAGVPAARFDQDGTIEGFVLWLDPSRLDEALRILDEVEDEGTEYARITIEVDTTAGTERAHAYQFLLDLTGRPDVGPRWPE